MLTGINLNKYRTNILDTIYPVGSIYMSVNATNPSEVMGGVWIEISQGRVLQGVADGETGGDTKEAGLPNITGTWTSAWNQANRGFHDLRVTGAYYDSYPTHTGNGRIQGADTGANSGTKGFPWFDASKGETKTDGTLKTDDEYKVFGKSDTVQPPAFLVHIFQRTA